MNQKLLSVAELLAHKNPNMKILEIGAGTGGATTELLRGFSRAGGPNAYQSYTFTDISAGFFDKAKKKFAEWDRIEFKTLDMEKDVSEQGFTEKYDLVVAANVGPRYTSRQVLSIIDHSTLGSARNCRLEVRNEEYSILIT